ncbi:MAG: hypothetical protein ACLUI5_04400 [Fusicatenibacter saccharivorans]
MSSERVKKELYETAMTGEKALTSLMYVQMTLYAAKSQKTYARVRSEGRARMRHTGLHMNQYLRAAGKDLESFRNRLKETHLPEELQSKAETFLVQTVHALDVTEKKQMYRRELIGMEEKVKETAEQIEGAAERHAGAWSISHRLDRLCVTSKTVPVRYCGQRSRRTDADYAKSVDFSKTNCSDKHRLASGLFPSQM